MAKNLTTAAPSPDNELGGQGQSDIDFMKGFVRPPDFEQALPVKRVVGRVLLRRPNEQHFVRFHPDPDHRLVFPVLLAATDGERKDENLYVVLPMVYDQLPNEYKSGSYNAQLCQYITRAGATGLWPIRTTTAGLGASWAESAREAVKKGINNWIRILTDKAAGGYSILLPDPGMPILEFVPVWPEEEYLRIVKLAFRDRFITDFDHPIIRAMHGA